MSTPASNSTLAALVAARARASAVRQKIGLEMSPAAQSAVMKSVQPENGPPPKAVVSPQAQATMGPTQSGQEGEQTAGPQFGLRPPPTSLDGLHVPTQGSGEPIQSSPPPGQAENMMAMAEQFHAQQGGQAAPPAQPTQGSPMPIAEFQQAMGRPPTPQEMVVMGARARLAQNLKREPTTDELRQYFAPKGK